jgi:hypothetical protein
VYHESRKNVDAMLKRNLDDKSILEGLKLAHSRMTKHITKESCLQPVCTIYVLCILSYMYYRYFHHYVLITLSLYC